MLELVWIVDLPVLAQTCVCLAVSPSAAVLGRTEGRTGGFAANRMSSWTLQRQLMRTVSVYVRLTDGRRAVGMLVCVSVEGTRYGIHSDWQIVTVDETDVIEISSLKLVKGDLCKGRRK